MNFSLKNITTYCQEHTTPASDVLNELERETNLKTLAPQMLAGSYQGKFLEIISFMIRPQRILEIGTFTGYSSICLAKGLQKGGKVITIETNYELEHFIRKYVNKAELDEVVELHIGDAKSIIPTLNESFDLVFIDAGKEDYPLYFEIVLEKLRPGGFIIADNVLWSGKVLLEDKDAETSALDTFNKLVISDPRVENIVLPIRDGISLIRKI